MKPVFVSLALLGLAGCLTTRADLRADQAEAARTPQEVAPASAPAAASVRPAPPPSAADQADALDEQLRQITGRLDVLENTATQAQAAAVTDKQNQANDKLKLDERFAAFEEALKKLQAQMQDLADDVTKLKAPPAPPPLPAPVKGRVDFDEGDSLFKDKKWKEAIVAFQAYRDANAKGKSYAEATYKIGVAFQEMGLKDESRSFYEEVTSKFPRSPEAKKAKQRLKALKK